MSGNLPLFPSVGCHIPPSSSTSHTTTMAASYQSSQKRELLTEQAPVILLDSSDDSDRDSKQKKHHRKKHKKGHKSKKERADKRDSSVLFLPNGNIVVSNKEENSELWVYDRSGDLDIIQYGSSYRLDIPSYEIRFPGRKTSPGKAKRDAAPESASAKKRSSASKGSDLYVSSLSHRYFGGADGRDGGAVICRTWLNRRDRTALVLRDKPFLPLPPSLNFPSSSGGMNTDKTIHRMADAAVRGDGDKELFVSDAEVGPACADNYDANLILNL